MKQSFYTLGSTGLHISPIGLGCWQFSGGTGLSGSYWEGVDQNTVNSIVQTAIDRGINWFDTAEVYGMGRSERSLRDALLNANMGSDKPRPQSGDPLVATKWWPAFRFAGSIVRSFAARKKNLQPFPVTLHQIHTTASFSSFENQLRNMAKLVQRADIQAVGVSNFNLEQMLWAHDILADHGLSLASNQVKYNLLDRRIEDEGLIKAAADRSITIIAYSPLGQGILTGKFHGDEAALKRITGYRKRLELFKPEGLARTAGLIRALESVGQKHGASAAQVALAWTIRFHGETLVAIPGASSVRQVISNAESMGLVLDENDFQLLDEASRAISRS